MKLFLPLLFITLIHRLVFVDGTETLSRVKRGQPDFITPGKTTVNIVGGVNSLVFG